MHMTAERVPFVPDDPSVLDVGAEFQPGLQVLGGEGAAVFKSEHVLGAVEDDQVAVVIDEPLVARVKPAVDEGLRSGLGILVVALEHRRAAGENFAILIDAHLGSGDGGSDRVELDVASTVDDRNPGHLGLSIDLLQVDAQ
jgi:hypothetical protein